MRPIGGANFTFRNCVVWNLIRDNAKPSDGKRQPTVQVNAGSYSLMNNDTQFLLGWNRIQNNDNASCVQFKSSGNTAIYNTIIDSKDITFGLRTGRRSYLGGNWMPSSSSMSIRGEGHVIIGNVAGGTLGLEPGNIKGGSAQEPSWRTPPIGWTFAEDVKMIGNNAGIRVNGPSSNLPYTPLRTLIENHTGSVGIHRSARETIDRRNSSPSRVVPAAYLLQASQVGPYS